MSASESRLISYSVKKSVRSHRAALAVAAGFVALLTLLAVATVAPQEPAEAMKMKMSINAFSRLFPVCNALGIGMGVAAAATNPPPQEEP